MSRKSYIILNIVFIAVLTGVFIYSYFINSLGDHITCVHQKYLGIDCPSCGMTRSFSALLHLDPKTAMEWNKFGFQIFLFFAIQLVLRVLFLTVTYYKKVWLRVMCKTDWIVSSLLFLICFYPFIISTFYLFYRMLFTGNVNL